MIKAKRQAISLSDIIESPEQLDPIIYRYYKSLNDRIIILNSEITSDIIEMAVLPLIELDSDGSGKEITIILNTNGGEVSYGFALISAIENSKTPITIKIMGMAASMGALIAMAGFNKNNVKTVCSQYDIALIHSGSQYLSGSSHSVKDTFKFQERYEGRIKQYILSHSNIDEDLYEKIERQEFWMDSDDMLKYGIVQEII